MDLIQILSESKKLNTALMSSFFLDSQFLRAVILPSECLEIAEYFVVTTINY